MGNETCEETVMQMPSQFGPSNKLGSTGGQPKIVVGILFQVSHLLNSISVSYLDPAFKLSWDFPDFPLILEASKNRPRKTHRHVCDAKKSLPQTLAGRFAAFEN